MSNYFEFYDGDTYHEYYKTSKGHYMHRYGFCWQGVMLPVKRISESEYVEAYNTYKGY